ncbi:MAG: permease [archaeon]
MFDTIGQTVVAALGLSGSSLAESLSFFVADSLKIIVLMFAMIAAVGFIRTYLPQRKVRAWLKGSRAGVGHVIASVFGALTPFCSCSSIPVFLGFVEAGVPLGITMSFLVTSPLVNEYLVVLMLGFFGWKITLAYVVSGLLVGIISGAIIGKLGMEKHLIRDVTGASKGRVFASVRERIDFGLNEAKTIVKRIWLWIVAGIAVGAAIHNYVPGQTIQGIVESGGYFSVPLAALLGVPMYGSCAAIVPIALVLFNKGVPIGTALAFMMATAALSVPEAIILKRAMKTRLIIAFFAVVTAAIIITGYAFNVLQVILT